MIFIHLNNCERDADINLVEVGLTWLGMYASWFLIYCSDGLLTVSYSTGIESIPDVIHGELEPDGLTPSFTAGSYTPQGDLAHKGQSSRLDILPTEPFAFSTKWWSKYKITAMNSFTSFYIADNLIACLYKLLIGP